MARAKKRSDGRYCVTLTVGKIDGKPLRKSFYGASIGEARRARDEYMNTHIYGGDGKPTEKYDGGMTLSAWAARWCASYKSNLEANTRDFYENQIRAICAYERDGVAYGDMPISAFRPIHISEYLASLQGMSRSTIRARKMTLQQIFNAARANGMIERDLCADIADTARNLRVKGTYNGHKALTREYINLINAHYAEHRFGLYAMLAIWTGARPAEICALTWDDVDFSRNVIRVRRSLDIRHGSEEKSTKTESGNRDIPIFAPLRRALFRAQDHGFICTAESGEPLNDNSLKRAWESFSGYMERLINGVPHAADAQGFRKDKWIAAHDGEWTTFDFSLYDLRVTFCTTLYDAGVDLKTAQKYMGHKDASTTLRIYTKLSEERETDSTDKMDAFIASTYAAV